MKWRQSNSTHTWQWSKFPSQTWATSNGWEHVCWDSWILSCQSFGFQSGVEFYQEHLCFPDIIIWWYRQWSTVQFLNTNYKDVGKFVKFDVTVLKQQEALETNFDQRWQVLVKVAVGHMLDRIWSLWCKRLIDIQNVCLQHFRKHGNSPTLL